MPGDSNKADFDFSLSRNFQARAFVDNAGVARKELPRLAEISRGGYGATVALDDVSIDIPSRIMVGVIGPDGVGKSSLLG